MQGDIQDNQTLQAELLHVKQAPKQKPKPAPKKSSLCCCCCFKDKTKMSAAQLNKMRWEQLNYKDENHQLPTAFGLLLDLYDGKDVYEGLENCRINPDYQQGHYIRNDLEYYIPQLTNFMILHEDFTNAKLQMLLHEIAKNNTHFAHLYYWYVNSLHQGIGDVKTRGLLNKVIDDSSENPQNTIFADYEKFCWGLEKKLTRVAYEIKIKEIEMRKLKAYAYIQEFKENKGQAYLEEFVIRGSDIDLKPYLSTFVQEGEAYSSNAFTSNLLFFEDLNVIADEINKLDEKLPRLKTLLGDINKSLPSCVYVPFACDSLQHYAILNIVVDETRIFSTKTRAPFLICVELFKPQEELAHEYNEMFNIREEEQKNPNIIDWAKKKLNIKSDENNSKKFGHFITREVDKQFKLSKLNEQLSTPLTLRNLSLADGPVNDMRRVPKKELLLNTPLEQSMEGGDKSMRHTLMPSTTNTINRRLESPPERRTFYLDRPKKRSSSVYNEVNTRMSAAVENHKAQASREVSIQLNNLSTVRDSVEEDRISSVDRFSVKPTEALEERETSPETAGHSAKDLDLFGEEFSKKAERLRAKSPFRHLKTWRLVPLIVKSGADLKEEQFAVQLVSQFDQIFKAEKLGLILNPYEIISLGPDIGVVEVVKDSITMSGLKEKLYREKNMSLSDFFVKFYGKRVEKARRNFAKSLAAYSLLCYFLQIKDRHNGNIMLHRDGYIVHIDYGFLLSSAPGKGIEFEKKVPFKLLNDYVEVLGGPRSALFVEFRKMFYKGFLAARKHSEQIIILVKMMYSSHGKNLPCFQAGDKTITDLEARFFPPGVNDINLLEHCYNLINESLDNWRAKCYDKFQYYSQGIFY